MVEVWKRWLEQIAWSTAWCRLRHFSAETSDGEEELKKKTD
jgi:hypothetical protein